MLIHVFDDVNLSMGLCRTAWVCSTMTYSGAWVAMIASSVEKERVDPSKSGSGWLQEVVRSC